MDLKFPEQYWTERWNNQETGWDIGHVSTPLKEYFDQLENKDLRIVIPGAGNAYEAEYLYKLGFKNVHVVDISHKALESFKTRVTDFPEENLICKDFFELAENYDLMIEQTFFCALHPSERQRYAKKAFEILQPSGKLVGLLFQIELYHDHPPFGGDRSVYRPVFSPYFDIEIMETATNSIKPRQGNELFVKMQVK